MNELKRFLGQLITRLTCDHIPMPTTDPSVIGSGNHIYYKIRCERCGTTWTRKTKIKRHRYYKYK